MLTILSGDLLNRREILLMTELSLALSTAPSVAVPGVNVTGTAH